MVEARLTKDVPDNMKLEIPEGPVELSDAVKQKLKDQEDAFVETLMDDVSALRAQHTAKADAKIAEMAREMIKQIKEEHVGHIAKAHELIELSAQMRVSAQSVPAALVPISTCVAKLSVEACRQTEVDQSAGEASGFGPRGQRLEDALGETMAAVDNCKRILLDAVSAGPSRSADKMKHDKEWVSAVRKAERQWQTFCDEHTEEAADGSGTPRDDDPTSPASTTSPAAFTSMQDELRQALKTDELESPSTGRADRTGVRGEAANTAWGAPSAPKPAEQKNRGGNQKANQLLDQLDALSKTMDNALGKRSTKPGAPPPPNKPQLPRKAEVPRQVRRK